MAEVAGSGVLHVDHGALDDFAGHIDGVRDRVDGVHVPQADDQAVGSPHVADALQAFVTTMRDQQERVTSRLANLTQATRNAAAEYQKVDESFTTALSGGEDA